VENIAYDPVGNITSLKRKGMVENAQCQEADYIDQLEYTYYGDGVRLKAVNDATFGTMGQLGFKDGSSSSTQYSYDPNGNIKLDRNKGNLSFNYNYLNLPENIGQMSLLYDALGRKWSKTGESGTVYYIDGFEFRNGELEAVYAPDGRLVPDEGASGPTNIDLRAEYWRQDHLGNTRVAFSDFNQNGRVDVVDNPTTIENELEITQAVAQRKSRHLSSGSLTITPSACNKKGTGTRRLRRRISTFIMGRSLVRILGLICMSMGSDGMTRL